MSSKWIILGLLAIALVIVMSLVGPFKGSVSSDFPDEYQPRDSNQIPPCPDSPNCVRLSVPMEAGADELFEASKDVLNDMGAADIEDNSDSLVIDAVFQIPVFGFQDDVRISFTENKSAGETYLHLTSRSRTGKSDLGVNRRRVNTYLESLRSKL